MRKNKVSTEKRYAIYLRCSTDDQKDKEYSTIDAQRQVTYKYVSEHGGTLVKEYADEGKTGTNLARPGWEELLRDARAGMFDAVCATYMSRIARGKLYHVAEYLLQVQCRVRIDLTEETFSSDLAGQITQEMTVFTDGMFPKLISQYTKTKMGQMVAEGYFCGGTVPFGYKVVPEWNGCMTDDSHKEQPKRLAIDEEDAELVRSAFNLFLNNGALAEVRDYLKRTTTRKWVTFTTKYLLTNPVYVGVQRVGDWRNDHAHPAVIDSETWQAVQDRISELKPKHTRAPISDTYTYYFRGLLTCPHCGCNYTNGAAKGGLVRYYQCLHDSKNIQKCPVARINAKALHDSVLGEIARAAEHWTVMHKIIAQSGGWNGIDQAKETERGQLAKKKQFIDVRIGNVVNAIEKGRPCESLVQRIEALENEGKEVIRRIQQLDEEIEMSVVKRPTAEMVQQVWSMIPNLWDEISESERTELIGSILKEVVVNQKDRVTLKLSPVAEVHGLKFATSEKLGAGVGFEPTTFGL
jgi:site-specific DNA recombinase